ncbi:MAG TPA: peptidase M48, partial [Cytophagaceae bacterium]
MNNKNLFLALLLVSSLFLTNCKKDDDGGGLNVFSLEDDIQFGKEMVAYIESDTSEYIVLDSAQYASAYQYLYKIRDYILQSNEVKYKNVFPYRVRIIKDDATLNAFALPGGYLYVYTG